MRRKSGRDMERRGWGFHPRFPPNVSTHHGPYTSRKLVTNDLLKSHPILNVVPFLTVCLKRNYSRPVDHTTRSFFYTRPRGHTCPQETVNLRFDFESNATYGVPDQTKTKKRKTKTNKGSGRDRRCRKTITTQTGFLVEIKSRLGSLYLYLSDPLVNGVPNKGLPELRIF